MSRALEAGAVIQAGGGRSYVLRELIGEGGFGAVYRARLSGASGFSKQVAIKVLRMELDQHQEFGRRFRDEARLLGLLRHRAIVHVDDLIQIDGAWALVMEFVPGADLSAFIGLGALPLRPALEITLEVASALRVAHAALDPDTGLPLGLVHRDIKPANIRLAPTGEVKVLDFGVARAQFSEREAYTRSLAFGSMGYLAPERLEGRDLPAADIYALGVVFYECLAGGGLGQLPIDSHRHRDRVLAALDGLRGRFEARARYGLLALLEAMLAYDPARRPSSSELEETLMELVAASPGPWLVRWAEGAFQALGESVGSLPGAATDNGHGSRARLDQVSDPRAPVAVAMAEPALPPPPPPSGPRVEPALNPPRALPTPAPPPPTPRTAPARRPGAALLGAAVLVVLVAGGLLGAATARWRAQVAREASPPAAAVEVASPPKATEEIASPPPPPPPVGPEVGEVVTPTTKAPNASEETTPRGVSPRPTPPPPPPPPPPGKIIVRGERGQLAEVAVMSVESGAIVDPSSLNPGRYAISVRFEGDERIAYPGEVEITSGETVVVRCDGPTGRFATAQLKEEGGT